MSVVRVAGRVWQGCRDTPTLLTTQSRQSTRLANEVLRTTANDPWLSKDPPKRPPFPHRWPLNFLIWTRTCPETTLTQEFLAVVALWRMSSQEAFHILQSSKAFLPTYPGLWETGLSKWQAGAQAGENWPILLLPSTAVVSCMYRAVNLSQPHTLLSFPLSLVCCASLRGRAACGTLCQGNMPRLSLTLPSCRPWLYPEQHDIQGHRTLAWIDLQDCLFCSPSNTQVSKIPSSTSFPTTFSCLAILHIIACPRNGYPIRRPNR